MIVILFWRFNPFQVFIMFFGEVELIFRILSVVYLAFWKLNLFYDMTSKFAVKFPRKRINCVDRFIFL